MLLHQAECQGLTHLPQEYCNHISALVNSWHDSRRVLCVCLARLNLPSSTTWTATSCIMSVSEQSVVSSLTFTAKVLQGGYGGQALLARGCFTADIQACMGPSSCVQQACTIRALQKLLLLVQPVLEKSNVPSNCQHHHVCNPCMLRVGRALEATCPQPPADG